MKKAMRLVAVAGAVSLLAACVDTSTPILGSGGGGTTTSPVSLGATGEGGTTTDLGLASLTDPLLGTTGLLGGGEDGALGQLLPAEVTTPIAEGLSPVVDTLASSLPLDEVLGQIPALGVTQDGGLLSDVLGQDPVGPLLGNDGTVVALLGGGNDGALGDLTGGGLPGVPGGGGSDPLAPLTDLLGGGLPGGGDNPLAPVTDLLGGGLPGGGDNPLAPVTDLLGGGLGDAPGLTLGVTGDDGLLADLIGQDPIGPALAPLGPVATLLNNGNDGLLGGIIPAGALPGGGGSDPLAPLTDLLGGGLPGGGDNPLAPVTDLLGGGLPGGGDSPLAPVTGALEGTPLAPVTDALAPVTGTLGL